MENKDTDITDAGEDKSAEEHEQTKYLIMNTKGKYVQTMDLGTFINPKYAECNRCPIAPKNGGDCEDFKKDADCIVERLLNDVMIQSLVEQGVNDSDMLLVNKIAKQEIHLKRLSNIQSQIDVNDIYNFDADTGKNPTLELYEKVDKMIVGNLKMYIQLSKELLSTRKERSAKRRGDKDSKSLSDLFADLK